MNQRWATTGIEDAPHEWRRQFHRGWVDGQHRAAWPRDADRMNKREQIAYEQGRALAVQAISIGLSLPIWRGDKAGAEAIDELWRSVVQEVGHVVPTGFVEAS